MRRSVTLKRALLALCGLALVVSACSSGSSALSKDEFVKQGNAICDAGNKTLDSAASAAFPNQDAPPDPSTIKRFIDENLVPGIEKQVAAIDALKPPKDLQAAVDKLLADARATLAKIKEQAKTDPASIFGSTDPFEDVNKQLSAVGLTTCANGGSDSSSSTSGS